jgi:2-polyprenyl-3-methyl-5-hydroxy-6-metoxy-1,4-benzoquinol methylase
MNFPEDQRFDLDKNWITQEPLNLDMIFCNQVFEHIFNPQKAISNITHHLKKFRMRSSTN